MKREKKLFIPILTLAAALWATDCRKPEAPASPEPEAVNSAAPASVKLSPEAVRTGGLTFETVAPAGLRRKTSAVGELEFNARRYVHLTARTAGRIETVLAYVGDRVKAGQVLAELYAPDFLVLQSELIQAGRRLGRLSADDPDAAAARSLAESARARLALLGQPADETAEVERTGVLRPYLSARAPFAGSVVESATVSGDHVELGSSLFKMADLSSLWACVHIQEKDLAAVRSGDEAELRLQAFPGETVRGRLALVGDVVEPGTRTVEGRIEVPNPGGRLKPGMYVEATLLAAGERIVLLVPEAALQEIGGKTVVFVAGEGNVFTLREVGTGERAEGRVEVVLGLNAGERVVVRGSFLLKSELLKGSLEGE